MNVLIIIFMAVATVFAIASLVYVAVDVVLELKNKEETQKEQKEEKQEEIVVLPPVVEEAPVEVMPEIVEHIDAEEADAMISDSLAMQTVIYENGAGHGKQGIINIGVIDVHFESGDVVTLAALKQKGLVPKNIGRIKVLADGILNKPLIIKAENYSVQAIKMIELTGGTVTILKD